MKILDPSFWKAAGLTMCAGMILHFSLSAQCVNNMATRSYDTVLTGIGYGDYRVRFPKWNPDSGLLASVKINARVSVHYAFALKNVDRIPSIYSLWVGREDLISSPAMSSPYDNITEQKIGVFPLNSGGLLSEGPFTFLDNYGNTDSITGNTAPFLGTDSVSFSYSPITYTTLHTNNGSSYSYGSTALDTVHFSLTYLYCKGGGILATNLTRFTALLQDPATVHLAWSAVNAVADRQYRVQRSRDGLHFTTIASLRAMSAPSDNGGQDDPGAGGIWGGGTTDYTYDDTLPAVATGKWYYRLQMTDPTGIAWSVIKEVTVERTGGGGVSVYPNPAVNFVDLAFDPGAGSGAGWQVELTTADGSRIRSGNYGKSNNIRIDFPYKLSAGIYFIRTTDLRGGQRFINRILIR
jgi:hypothetical protein